MVENLTPPLANYIKLGRQGEWESQSFAEGLLRFGYRQANHQQCLNSDWDAVKETFRELRNNKGQRLGYEPNLTY